MSYQNINIGLAIEQRINELNITKAEFGRRINMAKQNVTRILRKVSCDTGELVEYSTALDFNFFTLFCEKEIQAAIANNQNINGLVGGNNHISNSVVGGTADSETIQVLRAQLEEERAKSERYLKVIENLTRR